MRKLLLGLFLAFLAAAVLLQSAPVQQTAAQHLLLSSGDTYFDRVLQTQPQYLVTWPFDETAGTTARAITGLTPNVVGNGAFTTDISWTKGTGWTIDDGDNNKALHAAGTGSDLSQASILAVGIPYTVTFTVADLTAGTITPKLGSGATLTVRSTNATFTESGICAGSTTLIFTASSDFDGSIDTVSVTGPTGYGAPFNATYSGVTLAQPGGPNGRLVPSFDGVNDYVALSTTALVNTFNGAEGTIILPVKMSAAGVWTDGVGRYFFSFRNATNEVGILKSATNNRVTWYYIAGGTTETSNINSLSSSGWMYWAIRWSKSQDLVEVLLDGTSVATSSSLGTWNLTAFTSAGVGSAPLSANVHLGFTGPFAIWCGVVLTSAEISYIFQGSQARLDETIPLLDNLGPKHWAKLLTFPKPKPVSIPRRRAA